MLSEHPSNKTQLRSIVANKWGASWAMNIAQGQINQEFQPCRPSSAETDTESSCAMFIAQEVPHLLSVM